MEVLKNRVYRHFKGDYYIVMDIALNNENDQKYVIYRALYENGELYIRPYEDFCAEVDKNKYPSCTQKLKFELQDINSINNSHREEK